MDALILANASAVVPQHLAMATAAMAAASGPDSSEELVTRAFAMAGAVQAQGPVR